MTAILTGAAALAAVGLPFTDAHLTESINILPSQFGQLAAEGMFPAEGMTSAMVEVDIVNGVITALPVTPDGAPSTVARADSERVLFFKVPNVTHQSVIRAEDIRSMLDKAGRSRAPATLASEMNKHLARHRRKFDITLELMRTSALKGVLIDGRADTVYDFYTAFGVTKRTVFFDLGTAGTNVIDKCQEVIGHIEDNLSDETMTHVEARVSTSFFNKLIQHPNVEKYWLNQQAAQQIANAATVADGQYRPRTFTFGNIVFKEYAANVPMFGGTSQRIVAAGLGHAYPAGTLDSHVTYAAPPLDVRALDGSAAPAGSDDELLHVSTELLKHGRGIELQGQMNVLPMWRRPQLLVELNEAAA